MAARMGWAGWSAWGIYIVSGSLQGTLLVMAIVFEMRARRREKLDGDRERQVRYGVLGTRQAETSETDDEGGHVVEGSHGERAPLLGGRR